MLGNVWGEENAWAGCARLRRTCVCCSALRQATLVRPTSPAHPPTTSAHPSVAPSQTPSCTDNFNKWVLDMATHFKSLDQRHLLTVGSEGARGWGRAMRARRCTSACPVVVRSTHRPRVPPCCRLLG